MKKIVRLTESDLSQIIRRVINEQNTNSKPTPKDLKYWSKYPCVEKKGKPVRLKNGALGFTLKSKTGKLGTFFWNGEMKQNDGSRGTYKCFNGKIDITFTSGPGKIYQDSKKTSPTTQKPVGTKSTPPKPVAQKPVQPDLGTLTKFKPNDLDPTEV